MQPYHFLAKRGLIPLLENCWEMRKSGMSILQWFYSVGTQQKSILQKAFNNLSQFFFVGDFEKF